MSFTVAVTPELAPARSSTRPTAPGAHPVLAPALAGGGLAMGALALALVDPTHGPEVCPFHALTGMYCPGCGTTRGLHQLLIGHPGKALSYNALTILAMPLFAWAAFQSLTVALGGPQLPALRLSERTVWALVAVAAVWWVVRNLPFAPFTGLRPSP